MYNFTLIIPTHNRHEYLKRSMVYYDKLNAKVIYADSSVEPYDYPVKGGNILYLHLPGQTFAQKILYSLNEFVNTEYVALCADDDFILIESLYEAYNVVLENTEISTIVGRRLWFNEYFEGHYLELSNNMQSDVYGSLEERTKNFFNNYFQILWGFYKKEIIRNTFKIVNAAQFTNDNFIELVLGAFSVFHGNIKYFDKLWGVREFSQKNHWAKSHIRIPDMDKEDIDRNFAKMTTFLDPETYSGFSRLVLDSYLKKYKNRENSVYLFLKKLIPHGIFELHRQIELNRKIKNNITTNSEDLSLLTEVTEILYKNNSIFKNR